MTECRESCAGGRMNMVNTATCVSFTAVALVKIPKALSRNHPGYHHLMKSTAQVRAYESGQNGFALALIGLKVRNATTSA